MLSLVTNFKLLDAFALNHCTHMVMFVLITEG